MNVHIPTPFQFDVFHKILRLLKFPYAFSIPTPTFLLIYVLNRSNLAIVSILISSIRSRSSSIVFVMKSRTLPGIGLRNSSSPLQISSLYFCFASLNCSLISLARRNIPVKLACSIVKRWFSPRKMSMSFPYFESRQITQKVFPKITKEITK